MCTPAGQFCGSGTTRNNCIFQKTMATMTQLSSPAKERYSFAAWICFTGVEVNRVLRKHNKKKNNKLDRTYAICKRRKVKIKYLSNTTNMRQHHQRFHPATENAPPPVPAQQRTIPETVTKLPKNSEKARRITRAIGLFIGTDLQPYSVANNRAFRKILLARSTL